MNAIRTASLTAGLLLIVLTPDAAAVTVVSHFVGGSAPQNAAGGGNLPDVFDAAARRWASAYRESFTVHLYYGWASLGDAGIHTLIEQGGEPNREIVGMVLFDNSGATPFFLDPTPDRDEEYQRYTEEYQELGAGLVNVARLFGSPTAQAAGRCDLYSVAMHEIGHALGMCLANANFAEQKSSGTITIQEGLPFSGTVIPLASNNQGVTSHFDPLQTLYGSVMSGVCADERRIPSSLDILVNAQISGFRDVDFNPEPDRATDVRLSGIADRAGRTATRAVAR